jgi:hypothetical protein
VGEDTRQIEEEIRAERANLGRNLDELKTQARALTDWRTHYRNHTGPTLGIAFGGGLMLAFLTSRPSRVHHEPDAPRPRHVDFGALKALGDSPRARPQVGEAWEQILEALIGVAAAKAIDWIGKAVPGFRDEYESRQGSAGATFKRAAPGRD